MTKRICEVVYCIDFTKKEFIKIQEVANRKYNGELHFFQDLLINIKNVVSVTTFPYFQHSIYIQIQTESGEGFSNVISSCMAVINQEIN